MTKLRILTDAQLLQALGKITGHQVPAGTPFGEGLAEQADFFYYLSSARVIHERIPARRELWAQKVYKTKLAMKLSETPGQICLVSDSDMVGRLRCILPSMTSLPDLLTAGLPAATGTSNLCGT